MTIETTHLHNDKRYRYFQTGHTCRGKTLNDLISCNCTVYFNRVTKPWYRPIEWLIKKIQSWKKKINDFRA